MNLNEIISTDSLSMAIIGLIIIWYCVVMYRRDKNNPELQKQIRRLESERRHNKEFRRRYGYWFKKCPCESCQITRYRYF